MAAAELGGGVTETPGVTHEVFPVGGGPLSVYAAGDPGAPPVVLLHGAMYDEARFVWDQMFGVLAARWRVYAVDLPRHGSSRPWQGHLDHDRLGGILAAGFDTLGLDRFALVGLSMGGALAIEYAARHPARVERMALFEPGGLGERLDRQLLTWAYLRTPGTRGLLNRWYAGHPARLRAVLDRLFVGGSRPTDPERLAAILAAEVTAKRRWREAELDDLQTDAIGPRRLTWNVFDSVGRLACPTLWLRGAESTLVKQHEMERAVTLADRPGAPARLVVIPGAGHLLPLERPAEANAAVVEFLGDGCPAR